MNYAESFAETSELMTPSCRTDLLRFYKNRGYKEISRIPMEDHIPPEAVTRVGLEMVILQKRRKVE